MVEGEKTKTKDGKHRKYLAEGDLHLLQHVDKDLYIGFTQKNFLLEDASHCVQDLYDLLPSDSVCFDENCHLIPSRNEWLGKAERKLENCDILFFDPDNGVCNETAEVSSKHVRMNELHRFWETGKSLIVYHHLGREESHDLQESRLRRRFVEIFRGAGIECFRFRRGTARSYFMIIQPSHRQKLCASVSKMPEKLAALMSPLNEWRRKHSEI